MRALQILKKQRLEVEGVFVLLLGVILFAYQTTVSGLYHLWFEESNPTYSHGLLLLLVAAYLFIRRWQSIKDYIRLNYHLPAMFSLLMVSGLWMLAEVGNVQLVTQLSLLLLLLLTVCALFGIGVGKKLAFPVLLMLCALPVWDIFNTPLRYIAVVSVTAMLELSGILIVSDGFNLLVPAGIFKVDTGCSGLNQFIVSCVIGMLYSDIRGFDLRRSALVVGLALFFAIGANVCRIYIVVLSGQLTNMQHYFVTTDHVMLGWFVYAVFMLVYFFVLERGFLKKVLHTQGQDKHPILQTQAKVSAQARRYAQVALIVASVIVGPLLLVFLTPTAGEAGTEFKRDVQMPTSVAAWQINRSDEMHDSQTDWRPNILGEDLYQRFIYSSDSGTVEGHLYHYILQYQGKEAVHDGNQIVNQFWSEHSSVTQAVIPQSGGEQLNLRETQIISARGHRKLVWDWYYINGRRVSSPQMAKILNVWGILTGRPEITHYVIAIDSKEAQDQARRLVLKDFLSVVMPEIENAMVRY